MTDPLLGTVSIAAAFFAGILALLAPCCLTFLLPSYLAAGLQHGRWQLLRMTLIFSAGLAVVLLPVAWGIGGLAQLLPQLHRELFMAGGLLLLVLGGLSLTGRWSIPMPWSPRPASSGALSVFALGAFSGAASSCCAPVLAGVLALSVVAPTLWIALGVGLAYVFGMVFPLLLVAVAGQRFDLLSHPALRPRPLRVSAGGRTLEFTSTSSAAALLLWAMGSFVIWLGLTGEAAYSPEFLQGLYLWLRDVFDGLTARLGTLGPLAVLALAALVALVIARMPRRSTPSP